MVLIGRENIWIQNFWFTVYQLEDMGGGYKKHNRKGNVLSDGRRTFEGRRLKWLTVTKYDNRQLWKWENKLHILTPFLMPLWSCKGMWWFHAESLRFETNQIKAIFCCKLCFLIHSKVRNKLCVLGIPDPHHSCRKSKRGRSML